MNEELIIKAYELLVEKRPFDSLDIEEQKRVNVVFGSKNEYERMLSLSDMAMEEEEIIAPSMSAESALIKEFSQKHDAKRSKNSSVFSLFKLFSSKAIRIAIPSLVVLFGLTFFLNKAINEDVAVAEKTEVLKDQKTSNKDKKRTENPMSFKEEQEEKISEEQNRKDNDTVGENELSNGLAAKNKEELEIAIKDVDDEFEEEIATENVVFANATRPDIVDGSVKATYSSGTAIDHTYAPADNNLNFTWSDSTVTSIGTFTVQDVNAEIDADKVIMDQTVPAATMDSYNIDETYGNMAISNVEMAEVEAISTDLEKSSNKNISSSSSAINDRSLFDFLYTTY